MIALYEAAPKSIWTLFSAFFALALVGPVVASAADMVTVVIRTKINAPDPQAGEKSLQTIRIDFANKKLTQVFTTGSTAIVGNVSVGSVRDKFIVSPSPDFSTADTIKFFAQGQTASGVGILPNIDYKFDLIVTKDGHGSVSGCHDGYPAYEITVQGKGVYSFNHQPVNLHKLFGDCDTEIGKPGPMKF